MIAGVSARGGAKARPSAPAGPAPSSDQQAREFLAALETVSGGIRDPVAKLRYIRGSLSRYQTLARWIGRVPWTPVRHLLFKWLGLEGLRHLMAANPMGGAPTIDRTTRLSLAMGRAVGVAAGLALLVAATGAIYRLSARPASSTPVLAASALLRNEGSGLPAVAESLPPLPAGVMPAKVWLVEKGTGWEQYSNGLRIDLSHAVTFEPRRYRVFDPATGMGDAVGQRPVGILFHTSESDIWPLDESFNENLRDSSQRLLKYVQRGHLYHYLVDRFGRVFRVVDEASKANHAGFSIWAREGKVYLNLNHAFLGICFETRWEGGRALPITEAQLAAGRNLTNYLRQRYEIAPGMCVSHGLTSVNPKKHLIGHHVDWARGFPFEAFGLPNQYQQSAPSVALFGFGYDEDFIKVMGEPWAGVRDAERALDQEAARSGRGIEDLRRDKQALYDRWLQDQARDDEAAASPGRTGPRRAGL